MESTRKLAAIMFTDIQGYTALMQQDEAKAVAMRNRHREVFQRLHKQYNGTILQYYGDGTLSVFDSAIDAAQCGVVMQQELQTDPKVPLRIGIHTGDIIYSDTEAIGDGVNVASRVESVAVPGSVMISSKVYDYIKNQKEIPAQSMGMFNFKNVEKPLEVYALGLEGLVVPNPSSLSGKFEKHQTNEQKVAEEKAEKDSKKYKIPLIIAAAFLLGVAIWALSDLGSGSNSDNNSAFTTIKVKDENGNTIEKQIVRASHQKKIYAVDFENKIEDDKETDWLKIAIPYALEIDWDQDPYMLSIYVEQDKPELFNEELERAEELRVDYLLKGNYTATDSGYHIHPMLYNVSNGQVIREWDFEGEELFPLLDKIALDIKKDLEVPEEYLNNIKDLPLSQQLTESKASFKKLIEGIGMMENNMGKGIQLIGEAAEEDESFAYANMFTALLHHQLSFSKEVAQKCIARAMKHRKRLNETNETNVRMLNYRIQGQPEKAVQLALMMADLRPTQADLQLSLAEQYRLLGQWDKALDGIKRYQIARDDPDASIELELSSLYVLGRLEDGIERGEAFMKKNPEKLSVALQLGKLYLKAKNYEKAEPLFQRASMLDPEKPYWDQFLKHINFMKDSASYMTAESLQRFVGDYEVEFRKLSIGIETDAPFMKLSIMNQPSFAFFPVNSHTFFSEIQELTIKFDKDLEKEAERMFLSERGSNFLLCFKENEAIKEAHGLLADEKYEEALILYEAASETFADHYYLKNYIRHIKYMLKNGKKWTDEARSAFLGTYSAKEGQIIGTMTEKEGKLYLHQVNFPGTIEPSIILPMDKNEFMLPNSLISNIRVKKKGKKVVNITLLIGKQERGTLIKD